MKRKTIILRTLSVIVLLSSTVFGFVLFMARGQADTMMILFFVLVFWGIILGCWLWYISMRFGFFYKGKKIGTAYYSFSDNKYYGKINNMNFISENEDDLMLDMYDYLSRLKI